MDSRQRPLRRGHPCRGLLRRIRLGVPSSQLVGNTFEGNGHERAESASSGPGAGVAVFGAAQPRLAANRFVGAGAALCVSGPALAPDVLQNNQMGEAGDSVEIASCDPES